jgi:integrase/recombinase XerD
VFGKGGKTRHVLLSADTWGELIDLRNGSALDSPVFRSRNGGHLRTVQLLRVVRAAAARAGVELPVSTQWLRHAHASHAHDRGCPTPLVQATLGHASVKHDGKVSPRQAGWFKRKASGPVVMWYNQGGRT